MEGGREVGREGEREREKLLTVVVFGWCSSIWLV